MLMAISQLIFAGLLEDDATSEALNLFQRWKPLEDRVEALDDSKYRLAIALMASFALAGLAAITVGGSAIALLAVPIVVGTGLVVTMTRADREAREFQRLINDIEERI
jgi:hypothetical protein